MRASDRGMAVRRGVAPGQEMLELALDVGEQARRAEAKQLRPQPPLAQLFLHHDEPLERLLRLADAAGWLEPHRIARPLVVVADLARHDDANGQRRIDGLLTGRRFD